MMLIISVLRYRAAVHPLKPKIVCGSGYILGVIAGYGQRAPLCFILYGNSLLLERSIRGSVTHITFFFILLQQW